MALRKATVYLREPARRTCVDILLEEGGSRGDGNSSIALFSYRTFSALPRKTFG